MNLILHLDNVQPKNRLPFVQYIVSNLQYKLSQVGNLSKYERMEAYINSGLIKWFYNKPQYITVYNIYRLAGENLKIRELDSNTYEIYVDENINIPNSYTSLYSIISLLEYGTLSLNKVATLSNQMQFIADNLDTYYNHYMLGGNE